MDLASEFPEIVVSNCDQSPFLALVVREALNDPPRLGLWSALLVEAALRSRAVAHVMDGMSAKEELRSALSKIPRRRQWSAAPLVDSTFYAQVVTMGVSDSTKTNANCRLLELLRRAPAPGGLGWRWRGYPYFGMLWPLTGVGLMLWDLWVRHFGPRHAHNTHWVTWVALLLALCGYVSTLRFLGLASFYRSMLNLWRPPPRASVFRLMADLRRVPPARFPPLRDFIRDLSVGLYTKTERALAAEMAALRGGLRLGGSTPES
jgi:hypothetical protein